METLGKKYNTKVGACVSENPIGVGTRCSLRSRVNQCNPCVCFILLAIFDLFLLHHYFEKLGFKRLYL